MSTQSLEDFLAKMSEQSRTKNWDAVLVFDRQKSNVLLMQQYIDRFASDSYFPVVPSTEEPTGEDTFHVLEGLVLDKPRLSFENANVAESKGRMTIRMVGGKQIQLNEVIRAAKPVRTVTRLAYLDAVASPSLLMDITLRAAAAGVDSGGKVTLDVSKGLSHSFTGVETEFERTKMGLHFQKLFDTWDERLTTFELSELKPDADSLLQPGNFAVLTHAAPGARVRDSGEYGEGAVVVLVAMQGNPNGDLPKDDEDLLYMLPDAAQPYSSNLILGHKFMWSVVKAELDKHEATKDAFELKQVTGTPPYQLVSKGEKGMWLEAWTHRVDGGGLNPWYAIMHVPPFGVAYQADEGLRYYIQDRNLKMRWKAESNCQVRVSITGQNAPGQWFATLNVSFDIEVTYKPVLDTQDGQTKLKVTLAEVKDTFGAELKGYPEGNTSAAMLKPLVEAEAQKRVAEQIKPIYDLIKDFSFSIDAFRLNNLLFRGDNIVNPRDASWPTDLTLLGDLAPERTTLVASPMEATVPAGRTKQFTVVPAGATVWSVENLPGESGDTGRIDRTTGLYTAPSAASLQADGFRRVIVKATRGSSVSKVLVSLVLCDVSIYPSVLVVGLGKTHSLAAGHYEGADLDWTLEGAGLGEVLVDPDHDPQIQDGYKYKAPMALPEPGDSDPLNFWAARLDQVQVKPKGGGTTRTVDVLIAGPQGNYWFEPEAASGGGVKLRFFKATKKDPRVEVPADEADWHVYKGDGTLANGIYTPKAGSSEQYAVITAYIDDDEQSNKYAYMIVPVPFVSAQHFTDLLCTADKES